MSSLHLALALGGDRPSSPATWAHLVREAEVGLLDLVTLDVPPSTVTAADAAAQDADGLDAVRAATRLAATTRSIGLVPTVNVGRTDPGQIARALDALDRASGGRAGVHLQVPVPADEQGWVTAVRRRSAATHPGAGPLVALPGRPGRGRHTLPGRADLAFVTPRDVAAAQRLAAAARSAEQAPRHLLADVVVVLDHHEEHALERAAHAAHQAAPSTAPDGAQVFAGTPAQLADLALDLHGAGLAGLRLHPADPARDLRGITRGLVPELQRRGAFRRAYRGTDLRERLSDQRPADQDLAAQHRTAA
ncbi:hypothetical protein [Quadrisphaera setariae]|uniref:Flavin-dependent oxidoreductase, luciferase family (Includes alkanesulfonate monooxygenase SsuD and methylene tetrahydromethanopterin reductase) n=1 Tax=Quadrisphaera setariae TaxID=2593304 RepID=A0A5C8ZH85_9ACTN|nr:hypothetical protein [Quadrisphaera setariae]TXR56598.1 hypothetical protein FMM08_07370 [Quadrisphaera setariae]